jgi:hypothetical protein
VLSRTANQLSNFDDKCDIDFAPPHSHLTRRWSCRLIWLLSNGK